MRRRQARWDRRSVCGQVPQKAYQLITKRCERQPWSTSIVDVQAGRLLDVVPGRDAAGNEAAHSDVDKPIRQSHQAFLVHVLPTILQWA